MMSDHDGNGDGLDGPSDPHPGDAAVPSEGSLVGRRVYTSPDGAMYFAGKLHIEVVDDHGTEQHIQIAILIEPAIMKQFNLWSTEMENTVLVKASIEERFTRD